MTLKSKKRFIDTSELTIEFLSMLDVYDLSDDHKKYKRILIEIHETQIQTIKLING